MAEIVVATRGLTVGKKEFRFLDKETLIASVLVIERQCSDKVTKHNLRILTDLLLEVRTDT